MQLEHVLVGIDQESARAGGQVADALVRLGRSHLHHHADDVTGCAELAVAPGNVQMVEHVLEDITLDVLVLAGYVHLVDQLAGLDQQGGLADLALGVAHVLGERALLRRQVDDVGEDFLLEMG